MAPIRRYLRITKYSVLEVRIYLDNPALAQSWLLNPRNPVLPRVIEAVRPLVLPKLREEKERERSRKKGGKKRNIKDVVTEDDFEVAIFLTETNTRHSLLHKQKHFRDKTQTKLTSNSMKLTGSSLEAPINIEEQYQPEIDTPVVLLREDSDEDDAIMLSDIPAVGESEQTDVSGNQRPKRRRPAPQPAVQDSSDNDDEFDATAEQTDDSPDGVDDIDGEGSDDDLFVEQPPSKRRKDHANELDVDLDGNRDDKKKMAMDISYEGFAIYGRVLCLVVKRRGTGLATVATSSSSKSRGDMKASGQASMENWITSTQMPAAAAEGEADP